MDLNGNLLGYQEVAPGVNPITFSDDGRLFVGLDFQGNTARSRTWMLGLITESAADHRMHVMKTDDAKCLDRLRARNLSGDHPFKVSEKQFYEFSQLYYNPPTPSEGFKVVEHY